MRRQLLPLWMIFLMLVVLPACSKRMSLAPEKATAIPYDMKVGVACFSQPLTTSQLVMGNFPENQGHIPSGVLPQLDEMLRDALAPTTRLYTWLPDRPVGPSTSYHESNAPQALSMWVAYGRQHKIDLLLVPQILDWHQRQGSSAGVTESAHVRAEFFLIDVRQGQIVRRSVYEEKQVGLANNLLAVGTFFKRGAGWVTAEALTGEAIAKAIKDLGL